jgi:uncharacterized protein (DUF3084 family)
MIICPNCKHSNQEASAFCGSCGSKLVQIYQGNKPQTFVDISSDGEITVRANSIAEVKLALKELKLRKKELSLHKKQVTAQERQIQASYTNEIRSRGSKFQGGGGIGKFIRRVQTSNRDASRQNLAHQLAPYEVEKRGIEAMQSAIEQMILQLESYILSNS